MAGIPLISFETPRIPKKGGLNPIGIALGVLGATVGFFGGGPAGALVGFQAGSGLGGGLTKPGERGGAGSTIGRMLEEGTDVAAQIEEARRKRRERESQFAVPELERVPLDASERFERKFGGGLFDKVLSGQLRI